MISQPRPTPRCPTKFSERKPPFYSGSPALKIGDPITTSSGVHDVLAMDVPSASETLRRGINLIEADMNSIDVYTLLYVCNESGYRKIMNYKLEPALRSVAAQRCPSHPYPPRFGHCRTTSLERFPFS